MIARLADPDALPVNSGNLVNIRFRSTCCMVEFDSDAKLYALLRDFENRFYWWNIWQR